MAGREVEQMFVNQYRAGGILEQSKGNDPVQKLLNNLIIHRDGI